MPRMKHKHYKRELKHMEHEATFRKVNRVFFPAYALICAAAAIYYGIKGDWYHCPLAIGALLLPAAYMLLLRILGLARSSQLDFIMVAFILIAYPLGSVYELFTYIPFYDKICHTLSGVFTGLLALCLYLALEPEHRVTAKNFPVAMLFVFFASMAVAGLWEIGEYILAPIIGRDLQHVLETGVGDSMQDMIVHLAGTLVFLLSFRPLLKGRQGILTGGAEAFITKNAEKLNRHRKDA